MRAFRQALRSQWLLPFCLAAALPLGACSSGSSSNGDAAVVIDYAFDLPPGCPPATPNDKGIGGVCSKGGGECQNGLICACEANFGFVPDPSTPCTCTRFVTFQDSRGCGSLPVDYCGQGATCCSYLNAVGICVPTVCLENATCPVLTPAPTSD